MLDTPILIKKILGNSEEKESIQYEINNFNNNVIITEIILYELRNLYLDLETFFNNLDLIYKKYLDNPDLEAEVFPALLKKISFSYYRQPHRYGRLRQIYEDSLFRYLKNLKKIYLSKSNLIILNNLEVRKKIIMHRFEALKSDIKKNFYLSKKEIDNYRLLNVFPCPLHNWDYYYDPKIDDYKLSLKESCSKKCNNFKGLILIFIEDHKNLLKKILKNYTNVCKELDIKNPDVKFIKSLEKLLKIINNKNQEISTKFCKDLGDLFISLLVDDETYIYTNNINHFKPLIMIRGYDSFIISF